MLISYCVCVFDPKLVEQPEDTTQFFRDRATEFVMPLGAQTRHLRDPVTANEAPSAYEQLKNSVGYQLADYIQSQLLKRMDSIQSDAMWHEPILLTLVHVALRSRMGLDHWCHPEGYVLLQPENSASRKMLAQEIRNGDDRRRPVIVRCRRRFWVWHQVQDGAHKGECRMIPCRDAIPVDQGGRGVQHASGFAQALLAWLWLTQRDFHGETSTTCVISPLFHELLNEDSVVETDPLATEMFNAGDAWDHCDGLDDVFNM